MFGILSKKNGEYEFILAKTHHDEAREILEEIRDDVHVNIGNLIEMYQMNRETLLEASEGEKIRQDLYEMFMESGELVISELRSLADVFELKTLPSVDYLCKSIQNEFDETRPDHLLYDRSSFISLLHENVENFVSILTTTPKKIIASQVNEDFLKYGPTLLISYYSEEDSDELIVYNVTNNESNYAPVILIQRKKPIPSSQNQSL